MLFELTTKRTAPSQMFIAAQEWSPPVLEISKTGETKLADLHRRLLVGGTTASRVSNDLASREFLQSQLGKLDVNSCDLPDDPEHLEHWMYDAAEAVTEQYRSYLAQRKAGSARQFFTNRAHALYFLRAVAPTKLVDGAWLYGLLKHWRNPRFSNLIQTYLEELGDGSPDKNHVALYRQLLARHGLDLADDLNEGLYVQGLIQLALASHAEDHLPEIIGFNLGYEQLPLHLLISAYELNELGIDPYYFTLHVTVDNLATGHARRAVQSVLDTLPALGDTGAFWQRVRRGYVLGNAGTGTTDVVSGFAIEREVLRLFTHKSTAGRSAHSDYCRIGGRSVNDWLSRPDDIPAFLGALQKAGWIKPGRPAEESRFWGLLRGDHAEMFGVFSPYELQVIHDWIRGDASRDGQPYQEVSSHDSTAPRPSYRVAARLAAARGSFLPSLTAPDADAELLDPDLQTITETLPTLDAEGQANLLIHAMGPAHHWTPAGRYATRVFKSLFQA